MFFREAPQAIRQAKIDVLIIDQISSSMATVADYLGLPFITVCNAMLINREPAVPPYSTYWAYSTTPWARLRNRCGNALVDFLTRDLWQVIVEQRRALKSLNVLLNPVCHWMFSLLSRLEIRRRPLLNFLAIPSLCHLRPIKN